MVRRYRSLSSRLKSMFGESVRKITLDAGLNCPNRDGTIGRGGCIYCNPRGSGTGAYADGLSIEQQMDRAMEFLKKRYKCRKFIAYFQSFTNTYADLDTLDRIYSAALARPETVGLSIGTRPDCVSDDVLDLIAEKARNRLVWMEYGLQSAHAETLRRVNRGHGPDAFFDAVERTLSRNIQVVAHLILGLPGESTDDMVKTARLAAAAGIQGAKLHPLYVIKGTPLETMFRQGLYQPLTEQEAAEATLAVLGNLPRSVVIHRFTSDPHQEELAAPMWMLDGRGVRRRLELLMEERGFMQGADCG
ncbi:MAG: TIGR01212 family radical SAM protein [Pseudomonadota bacterium]